MRNIDRLHAVKSHPIGIFDSGVGGLSVWQHIQTLMPHESLFYVADAAYAPYGDKSVEMIRQRSLAISQYLVKQPVKALVVACNTATAAAVTELREQLDIPVIAMEPAVKPAVQHSRSGKVGILATNSTLQSQQYRQLVERFGHHADIIAQPCHGLVECVEKGWLDSEETYRLLDSYLQPLLQQGVDTVVLGCTHYPFLIPVVEAICGPEVRVIDTGIAVARQLQQMLQQRDLLASGSDKSVSHQFRTSGDPTQLQHMIVKLLGQQHAVSPLLGSL